VILGIAPEGPVEPGGAAPSADEVQLTVPREISRETDLGDSIMTAAILAPFMGRIVRLTDLGRLRLQETERVHALRIELTKCGVEVLEEGDTLTIFPSQSVSEKYKTMGIVCEKTASSPRPSPPEDEREKKPSATTRSHDTRDWN